MVTNLPPYSGEARRTPTVFCGGTTNRHTKTSRAVSIPTRAQRTWATHAVGGHATQHSRGCYGGNPKQRLPGFRDFHGTHVQWEWKPRHQRDHLKTPAVIGAHRGSWTVHVDYAECVFLAGVLHPQRWHLFLRDLSRHVLFCYLGTCTYCCVRLAVLTSWFKPTSSYAARIGFTEREKPLSRDTHVLPTRVKPLETPSDST